VLPQTVPIHPLTVDDVMAMVRAGILDEHARIELVDGVLVEMVSPGPQHGGALEWLTAHFVKGSDEAYRVRVQDTLVTPGRNFLMPDLMVIMPLPRDRLPDSALLVVEIAYTSRARDVEKAETYAAVGVPEYWIVDVDRDDVLVHRQPRAGTYTSVERFVPGDVITPLVAAPPVDVAALLGRAG
jgi:Uma2 family endonuclease